MPFKEKKLVSSLSPIVNASTLMKGDQRHAFVIVLAVNYTDSEIEAFLTVTGTFVFIKENKSPGH